MSQWNSAIQAAADAIGNIPAEKREIDDVLMRAEEAVRSLARKEKAQTVRGEIIRLLWEKQFEGSPWSGKFHLIRPDSLEADYGTLADKIIAVTQRFENAPVAQTTDHQKP
jgi:hypothetical protein